jgi:molybdate transport system substrate-binding protein
MRRLFAALALWIFALAAAAADHLTVFAAASLKDALDAAVKSFEAQTRRKVAVSYAASGSLARQIEAGAPASIFISADLDWADYVESRGLAMPGTRTNLLGNDLVLVAPAASPVAVRIAPGFELARALGNGRLAVANPQSVPAALALVARGEAPLGIVYRTDAVAENAVRIVDAFPAASHTAIVYPMIVLKGSAPAARELAAYLASPRSRAIWQKYGFKAP